MRRSTLALVLVTALLLPAASQARFSVQKFSPSPHVRDFLTVESSEINEHLVPAAHMMFNYATKPLVFAGTGGAGDQGVVDSILTMDLLASMSFFERFEIGLDVPFFPYIGGDDGGAVIPTPKLQSLSLGDIRFTGKVNILPHKKRGFGLAADLGLTFPTSRDDSFVGEESLTFIPKLIADVNYDDYRIALNIGYRLRKNQSLDFLAVNDELLIGIAGAIPVGSYMGVDNLSLIGELQSSSAAANYFGDKNNDYLEGDIAARYITDFGLGMTLGGGGGFLEGVGNPQFRLIAGIGYTPLKRGPQDRDHDGIFDEADLCPDRPEDVDGYKDADGCPDPDNDNDGINDKADKCPNKAEDLDAFEDTDGCPDADNDKDGVPDARDRCPMEPEDKDGFEDADGCIDRDNDNDGIPDTADKCIDEPETKNLYQDEDGCPDKAPVVFVTKEKIIITQKIYFRKGSDRILKKSKKVVKAVADILKEHKEILKVSVEGHTSTEGSAKGNKRLSKKRAKAIVRYLTKRGISKKRLEYKGFGEEKPITEVPEKDKAAREKNRRVEFIILEQAKDKAAQAAAK